MSSLIVLKTSRAARARRKIGEYWHFLCEFLYRPATIGALAPSSTSLATAMLRPIDFTRAGAIAELGAGTGSFTKHILRRKGDHVRFVALETNPRLFAFLAERWEPACFAQRSAEELRDTLNERGIQRAGAIVSGLPWASLGRVLQKSILQQVSACLAPEGVFVTFAYPQGLLLPGGIRFRRLLDQQFASVERTKVVWKNLPPAFVYVCRRQASAAREAA